MFFTRKYKEAIFYLDAEIDKLKKSNELLTKSLEIQKIRIDALMKLYPYGANSDGSPRKKPGRKRAELI